MSVKNTSPKTFLFFSVMLLLAGRATAQGPVICSSLTVTGASVFMGNLQLSAQSTFYVQNPAGGLRFQIGQDDKILMGTLAKKVDVKVTGNSLLLGNSVIAASEAGIAKWQSVPASSKALWGLWVEKGVVANDFAIAASATWADYVFDSTYKLPTLQEVENYIQANKHLPGMLSAQKVKEEGYTMHDLNTRFLQKIEELTLYSIGQDKKIGTLQQQINDLEKRLAALEGEKKMK